jgi:hypothetical protein
MQSSVSTSPKLCVAPLFTATMAVPERDWRAGRADQAAQVSHLFTTNDPGDQM